jgi:imidazolonepropionase-like amidohydrolase
MWSVTTPRAIFPKRSIGELRDGYEASFLVLRADPLADIAATRAIALRVKKGVRL